MHAPSCPTLLRVWEQGQFEVPVQRALTMLTALAVDVPKEKLATLDISQRDQCMLTLRELAFGPTLKGLVHCPACGERLEFDLAVEDLRSSGPAWPANFLDGQGATPATFSLEQGGYKVEFRLPDSLDLTAIEPLIDCDEARNALLLRCLVKVRRQGAEIPSDRLPPEIVTAVVDRMTVVSDPADAQISFTCQACAHSWETPLDIAAFLWSELNSWAQRTLHEVHLLATAYGWSEREILAMSAQRRRAYLNWVGV